MFYADVGLANNDSAFEQTLEALKDKCDDFRLFPAEREHVFIL
jgi:hypothetical protein